MKTIYIFLVFVVVALAQLYVPASMIFQQEKIIDKGVAYKFKTQPIDPADPFKGKYIRLNYEIGSFPSNDSTWTRNQDIYVSLANDSLGFANIAGVSKDVPSNGDFIKTTVNWYDLYDKKVVINFQFEEFYMNETKALDAEIAHRDAQRDSLPNNTYALVYVLDGNAVLDNVFINDIPIADYVEKD